MAALTLLSISVLLSIVTKNKIEYILFPVMVLISTVLMIFGLSGNIMPGIYLIVFASIVALISEVFMIIRSKGKGTEYFFTPGFVAFIIGAFILWILCCGRQFIKPEELVFSGPSVRYLFEYDSFAGEDMSFWDLNDTFPFVPLWCCFFMKLGSGFREDVCIFAKDLFILAGFVSVFGITGRKRAISDYASLMVIMLLIPVIKIQEMYSQLEFYGPQAAAVFYTLAWIIKIGKEWAGTGAGFALMFGVIASCVTTRYGSFAAIPVMAAGLLVSYRKKKPEVVTALIAGCIISLIPGKFRFDLEEISRLEVWYPVIALGLSLVLALIIICTIEMIRSGHVEIAIICIILLTIGVCYGMFYYVRGSSIELSKVVEWMNEYNKKIFSGTGEEDYLMGKYAVGVYDIFFLIASACVSAYLYMRKKQKCESDTEKDSFDNTGVLINASVYGGIFLYFVVLSAVYVLYLRCEGEDKPIMAWYIFPAVALACCTLISDSTMIRGKRRRYVLPTGAVIVSMLAFTDPIGGIFDRPGTENDICGICHDTVKFDKGDKVFYIDTEMMQTKDLPPEFKWKVFPAEYASLSGLYFTPNPQDWSTDIIEPMEIEELENLIRERDITHVYLRKSSDFFFESYWPLFDRMGQYIDDDKLYKVTYDAEDHMILEIVE